MSEKPEKRDLNNHNHVPFSTPTDPREVLNVHCVCGYKKAGPWILTGQIENQTCVRMCSWWPLRGG